MLLVRTSMRDADERQCDEVVEEIEAGFQRRADHRQYAGADTDHDRVEPFACALALLEIVERIGLEHVDVRQPVEREVLPGALEGSGRRVDRGDARGSACEMESEGSVIAETVQRAAKGAGADER